MKKLILSLVLLLGFNSYAQLNFSSYEKATLKLRNGDILIGEARITDDEKVNFRKSKGNKKQKHNYRTLESFRIYGEKDTLRFTYKIIAGKEPRLMRVLREYPGRINLYAIEYFNNTFRPGGTPTNPAVPLGEGVSLSTGVAVNASEYYLNKGNGFEVVKIGNDHPVFGKRRFKNALIEFFEDCPKLIEKVEENEFSRREMEAIVDFYITNCHS
ncbi:hypothetical protein [Salegentibacter sp. Hel_I_6]|uniref:hypothetical protein n=1 Tax=Salegentibacter sp. Hel_I_6 TaxID=1250278 RepID=UPI0005693CA5|nr:hypothetical protein [Salegentibacter sp. Hel_I_6]